MKEIRFCKCGCGEEIVIKPHHKYYGIPNFIRGHNTSWIKGKIGILKHSEEWKEEARQRMLGTKNPFYGKTHSEETKKKLKLFKKGHIPYMKGKHHTDEAKKKNRLKHIGIKQSRETIKKRLQRRSASSLELKMIQIIKKYNLPYRFVGNGKFFVGRKCPDFINTKGKKIAIEVFYRKHKEYFTEGLNNWKIERTKVFNDNGWDIVFLDETKVNENVKEILI